MTIINEVPEKHITDIIFENKILKKKLKIQTRILRYLLECGEIEVDFLLRIVLNIEKTFNEKIIGEIISKFKESYDNIEYLEFNNFLKCVIEILIKKFNQKYTINLDLKYDFNVFFNGYTTTVTLVENWSQKFENKLSRAQIIKIEKLFERIFE